MTAKHTIRRAVRSAGHWFLALLLAASTLTAVMQAATVENVRSTVEHVTLRNGFELDCVKHQNAGEHVRLYTTPENYIEVPATQVAAIEVRAVNAANLCADEKPIATSNVVATQPAVKYSAPLTQEQLHPMLAAAGTAHNIDADLLWSVVKAESAGNPQAVSRAGAQGLMQLMPATANELGVADSFAPQQNISGGAAYLDMLLTRYHDDMALALAAYNAGPEAVDRYHGIPPYRETRSYVARVIAEFNRRKRAMAAAAKSAEKAATASSR